MLFDGKRWAYGKTSERVNKLANALKGLGIKKGDRLGMLEVNCSQYAEAYFAAAKVGAIFVPLNFRAKEKELNYMIGNAGAKMLIVGGRYLEMVEGIHSQLSTMEHCVSLGEVRGNWLSYEGLVGSSPSDDFVEEIDRTELHGYGQSR